MLNPQAYQNSNPPGAAYIEIVQHPDRQSSEGEGDELSPRFMPLKHTRLTGAVHGPVANLRITHLFGHPDESGGPVLEAVYRFPLPGDAAVTGVQAAFGDVRIRAELADRNDAEEAYDHARATGHQAILLTRESPDVFSLHISGIESGQDVEVVTDCVQSLTPNRSGFQLRIPLTPAPRYTSMAGAGGRHEHGQPLTPMLDPGHRFQLDLTVAGASSVSSKTHAITSDGSATMHVKLADGDVIPDRDLVLDLTLPAHDSHSTLQAYHYLDEAEQQDYFLALVTPPDKSDDGRTKPREIILLVDRSGSMTGAKWKAADWAVRRFLSSLRPDDHFSVGLFHSDTRWFSRVCVPASRQNVTTVQEFVDAYDDSGGTELERALEEAITCGRTSGEFARHIIIITDAQVSNARDNLALARAESDRSNRRRISMLCIDAAPNAHLVHELVAIGGGQASFLTSDPDEGDIATALDDIMSFWDRPAAIGLELTINRPDVWVMGRPVSDYDSVTGETGTIDIGDLPAGRPIWVTGRSSSADDAISFDLASSDGPIASGFRDTIPSDSSIKAIFGARRLNALEYQQMSPTARWSRPRRAGPAGNGIREQLVAESLRYGLICSETSFIAVREEAGELVQRGAIVPNALPTGWSDDFLVYQSMPASPEPGIRYSMDLAESPMDFAPLEPVASESRTREIEERGGTMLLYRGRPDVSERELVLYEKDRFESRGIVTALLVSLSQDDGIFDGELLLFVGQGDQPRARVRLRDMLDQGGERPLNIRIARHHPVRLVLRDVVHGDEIPELEIKLRWE